LIELLRYESTIYDANCLVYFVFVFEEKDRLGNKVTIIGPNTSRVQRITNGLLAKNKRIRTLRAAWEEAEKITVASALNDALKEGYIQMALGVEGHMTAMLRFRLVSPLKRQLAELKGKPWLLIEGIFSPKPERIGALRQAYANFAADPEKQKLIPPYKGDPSLVDLALILYSGESKLPLLTNDRELYNFSADLRAMGFCELIKAFPYVKF